MKNDTYRGFVISHTHWDREWYLSFQEFRKWLVRMIDDLLDNLPKMPAFQSFMLDGQTVVIEDYLTIRPNREQLFRDLLKQKRLIIGPFYVLADEFIESGEGIVRNLLLGHKISEQFGVAPMKVGYVPDTFGHIWQMPQILQGFGINSMYYFRGYPPVFGNHEEYKGKNEDTPLEHWYESPDGSKVLTLHHITGYGNASGISENPTPDDPDFPYMNAIFRVGESFNRVKARTKTNLMLVMNGTDHRQAEWNLPDLISRWNTFKEIQEDYPIILEHNTLENYFKEMQTQVDKGIKLPILTGEARGSMYTQVTPGCISTRMNLKLFSWKCSRELEKYAEPFSTVSWVLGAPYQDSYIDQGWRWLIQNHPHDSICGCSLDRVHEDMIARFNWSYDNASDVANYSFASILSGMKSKTFPEEIKKMLIKKGKSVDIQLIGVFNPNAFEGPFVIEDYLPLASKRMYKLMDLHGKEIENVSIEYIEDYRQKVEEGQYLYKRFQNHFSLGKVTAVLYEIPPCGYRLYYLVGIEQEPLKFKVITEKPAPIDTPFFNISFNANGSINLLDNETKIQYKNLNLFEDGADDGDEYDYGPLPKDRPFYTNNCKAIYKTIAKNQLFTEVQAEIDFSIPYELLGDADSVRTRSKYQVSLNIITTYRIYLNHKLIQIHTKVKNKAKGHRFRAIFPTDFQTQFSYADDHFMAIKRTITLPKDDGWYQDMQGIYHQDTFVDLNDTKQGLAILNRGICEFEIIPQINADFNCGPTIALTLFRSVAWLSQKGHLGRKSGLNGPNLQTPGAQLMDYEFELDYAIFPHQGSWEDGNVYQAAHAFNSPPRWFSERHHLRHEIIQHEVPWELGLVKISNPNVILSTIKRSDKINGAKDGIIMRVFNPSSQPQNTLLHFGIPIKAIFNTNLLEQDQQEILMGNQNKIEISFQPYKISTIRLEF